MHLVINAIEFTDKMVTAW